MTAKDVIRLLYGIGCIPVIGIEHGHKSPLGMLKCKVSGFCHAHILIQMNHFNT